MHHTCANNRTENFIIDNKIMNDSVKNDDEKFYGFLLAPQGHMLYLIPSLSSRAGSEGASGCRHVRPSDPFMMTITTL